ncbi:hypothetical protein JB92DRAFT_3117431 [Gautieria morchelliformis]|nr:hypothetical protein JB92DRAFT_3117431 [Gautieria morchelliformis]
MPPGPPPLPSQYQASLPFADNSTPSPSPCRVPSTPFNFSCPSPVSSPVFLDQEVSLRLETFSPYRERIRTARVMLTWTRLGEQVFNWPTHADGRLYTDYELPEAFEKSYIELPQCPCATQETNPATTHYYHIWVVQSGPYQGKVAAGCAQKQQGCNAWICLTDLICVNPSLPSQHYARRPDDQLGPGLPNFDRCGLLTRNSNGKNCRYTSKSTNTHGDVTPPPPYRSARNNRRGFGGITKVTGSSASKSGIKKHATLHPASNDDPFVVTPEPCSPSSIASSQLTLSQLPIPSVGTSRSPSRVTRTSSESLFTLPHLPLPSTTSTAPTTIGPAPPESEMPPSNQLELQTPSDSQTSTCYDNSSDIQTTPRSQQNLQLYEAVTIMPEGYFLGAYIIINGLST